MRAIVLGAAAGGGYPQWNCGCAVCALAWSGDGRVRRATQSSVAVSANGVDWMLLNASPDIGTQIAATPALHPRQPGRHSPIKGVVLTNGDIDHVAGLLSLREGHKFPIFALGPVRRAVGENAIFSALIAATWHEVSAGETFESAGLTFELVAVPGKLPLYLEGDDPALGSQAGETAGVIVRDGEHVLAYMPGCADLTDDALSSLKRADVVLFDGTLATDDEMIKAGLGSKTGRRMGHVPVFGDGGSLQMLAALPAARKIYVHLNNTNPLWMEGSHERSQVEHAGVEIAYDGMEIVL